MPREITLQEYQSSGPHTLSSAERTAIQSVNAHITLSPATPDNQFLLSAGSTVGAFEAGGLSVLIEPKIGIPNLLSLACYAIGQYKPQDTEFDFPETRSLPDALALALANAARHAFSRGLLHGYLRREEALQTVRGRIRFSDQIRHRYGIAPPVEVRYQEFTDDILENQLVKAAARRLAGFGLKSRRARRGLGWIAGILDNVSFREFRSTAVPDVTFGRLNEHYRGVVTLARLILSHGEFESGRGAVRATGFLMDMNRVFEEFLAAALREQLRGAPGTLRTNGELKGNRRITLDVGQDFGLFPDLTWWHGERCLWVGDAKYKNVASPDDRGHKTPSADLYQMLAYTTALDLPSGTLIYAKGEADPTTYTVKHAGKTLHVQSLDITRPLDDVLDQVAAIAPRLSASVHPLMASTPAA